jgi:hypothetical protein
MHKKTENLHGGLAAAVLACSLAVFGCSTNHTPGDGQPSMTPPMTPSATPGSSSGTTNPPMASAMDSSMSVQRANDAAAIVAAHPRERFLGYINPTGPQPTPSAQYVTGQLIPPSMYANPEATVNASISSEPTPVISSGVGGSGAATFVAAPASVSAPTAGAGATSSATVTPTSAALFATPGQFAAGASMTSTMSTTAATTTVANTAALTPTLSSAATPSPTLAANPPLASVGVTSSSTTTPTSSTTPSTTPAATGRLMIPGGVVTNGSVRAVTNASGAVVITNVPMVIKGK